MDSYLCNTSWSTQWLLLLGMRSNSKWYYIRSGVIEIQGQVNELWTCIQKEVCRWFTKCYEPSKVWFLLRKKPMRLYFFCIIPWSIKATNYVTFMYLSVIRHAWIWLNFLEITNCQYLGKEMGDCLSFLYAVRHT